MKYLSCDEAGFMSLSCELTCVTYETLKRDGVVSYIWRCSYRVVADAMIKRVEPSSRIIERTRVIECLPRSLAILLTVFGDG